MFTQWRLESATWHTSTQLVAVSCCQLSTLISLWLGGRKGIWPVKAEWWEAGMVVCMGQGVHLHMAQLMPLPLTISCSSKSRLVLPFWYQFTWVVTYKWPLNRSYIVFCASVINYCLAEMLQYCTKIIWACTTYKLIFSYLHFSVMRNTSIEDE